MNSHDWDYMAFWLTSLDMNDLPERFHNGKRMVEDKQIYLPDLRSRVKNATTREQAALTKEIEAVQKAALRKARNW